MAASGPSKSPYEQEALAALAVAIIKEPQRKAEFEKHAKEWIQAYSFYREHTPDPSNPAKKIDPAMIESQLRGIDFNFPIKIGYIPPPALLAQFQPPTTEGQFPKAATGNYWAEPGQTPQALGISDYGKMRDPKRPWAALPDASNVKKTAWQFEADTTKPSVPALYSTAAPVVDNWSRRTSWSQDATVVSVLCPGGGKQIFAPQGKELLALKADQKAILAADSEEKLMEKIEKYRKPK
jgi:hypothetical protein